MRQKTPRKGFQPLGHVPALMPPRFLPISRLTIFVDVFKLCKILITRKLPFTARMCYVRAL